MSKPVIFTVSATWDEEASRVDGSLRQIPAAADAPTLDELLAKISAMALDLLPDNHPGIDPADVCSSNRLPRYARRSRWRPEWQPDKFDTSRHTANGILRQAGLPKAF